MQRSLALPVHKVSVKKKERAAGLGVYIERGGGPRDVYFLMIARRPTLAEDSLLSRQWAPRWVGKVGVVCVCSRLLWQAAGVLFGLLIGQLVGIKESET